MKDKEPPQDLLDWMGVKNAPNWVGARSFGRLIGTLLVVAVPALFVGSLIAAFVVLWHTVDLAINGEGGAINLGAGALITALLGAPFLIWSTVLKHQTVRYQKEGHITDRINKAVEQLGAEKSVKRDDKETTEPNIEVRIGAILSLERIAQDSTRYDKGRDHVRVMEILCAYVRENSNARAPRDFPLAEWEPLKDDATKAERKAHEMWREVRFRDRYNANAREWAASLPKPRADIAQTLQVLGRRTADQRRVEAAWPNPPEKETVWPFDVPCPELSEVEGDDARTSAEIESFKEKLVAWRDRLRDYSGYRLDLRGANLQGADLSAKRPDASNAVFSGAIMQSSRLEGADLSGARLEGIELQHSRMEGVFLKEARIEAAEFITARMEGVNLTGARMRSADFSDVKMEASDMRFARMEEANFRWARMECADLTYARMSGAGLSAARLSCANLSNARMDRRTELLATSFNHVVLRNASYSDVDISANQVSTAFGDASVSLPIGVKRPAHWPRWELDYGSFRREYRKWRANPDAYTPPPQP
ncbi:pentapeptide repeat-containing protein [Roseovarius mucosus]|uniref:pentapeptide repeat-containing protein n=1 Tax=Roseovarius mucosus TaxID=215743 RepID=UPI0035CE9DAD|tara:strand:- start:3175 stop:4785 length:1611 start_codon:yes stop_codon:yes gene_type:complete